MINFVKNTPPKRPRKLVSCSIDQHDKYRLEVVTQTIAIFISGALVWDRLMIKMLLTRRVHGETFAYRIAHKDS